MAEVLIRWDGIPEASNVMRSIGNNATRYLNPTIRKILKPYRVPIRRTAPLGPTGNLRRGIAPAVSAKGVAWVEGVAFVVRRERRRAGRCGRSVRRA